MALPLPSSQSPNAHPRVLTTPLFFSFLVAHPRVRLRGVVSTCLPTLLPSQLRILRARSLSFTAASAASPVDASGEPSAQENRANQRASQRGRKARLFNLMAASRRKGEMFSFLPPARPTEGWTDGPSLVHPSVGLPRRFAFSLRARPDLFSWACSSYSSLETTLPLNDVICLPVRSVAAR